MSLDGLPAAIGFVIAFAVFTATVLVVDLMIYLHYGLDYTITYGVRYMIKAYPLAALVLVFLFGALVGGLMVHFADPSLNWGD